MEPMQVVDMTPGQPLEVPVGRSLADRMVAASKRLGWINKRGENAFHKYKYAYASDVFAAARDAMAEEGIVFMASVDTVATRSVEGLKGTITDIGMSFSVSDDAGMRLSWKSAGSGADTGDKGIYKAMTGALKYGLILAFLLPTGDDPEADAEVDKRGAAVAVVTEAELFVLEEWLSQEEGSTEKVLSTLGIKSLSDLTPETYARAMSWVKRKIAAKK